VDPVKCVAQAPLADGKHSVQRCNVERGLTGGHSHSLSLVDETKVNLSACSTGL